MKDGAEISSRATLLIFHSSNNQAGAFELAQFVVPDAGSIPVSGELGKGHQGRLALKLTTNEQTAAWPLSVSRTAPVKVCIYQAETR